MGGREIFRRGNVRDRDYISKEENGQGKCSTLEHMYTENSHGNECVIGRSLGVFAKLALIHFVTGVMTCNSQSQRVVGRPRVERDGEALRRLERLEHVAHHVDLCFLVPLSLAPPDRVVEQVEPTVGRELTVQSDRLAGVDE